MSLASALKKARKNKKLTQDDMSQKLNVSRKTISSWENGRNYPDATTLINLSEIYDVSLDNLMKDKIESSKNDNKNLNLKKIFYYLNVFFLVLSFINLIKPFNIHMVWVTPLLVLNLCGYIVTYHQWNYIFHNKAILLKIIITFMLLFPIVFIFGMNSIVNTYPQRFLIPATIGMLIHILTMTISFIVSLYFHD